MTLAPGSKLGSYEVLSLLGAGGMGEVYRARDAKLGRDVALKVLPHQLIEDPQRMARFEREARLLASLNHPNIGSIYGLEDSGVTRALILELVDGPTLADRIKQSPLAIDEVVKIARQIADALEYAHERGVIHRDLKPANIKLTQDGVVKVLDFGLAKAVEADSSSADISTSPTISRMATQAGIILGTAAYMSPEQARGKSVDRRTDIWALGCVMFEMLTGHMTFQADTVTDTIVAVVGREPDWSFLPASTPARLRELLRRCLKKDVKSRVQAIGDARITLEETLSTTEASDTAQNLSSRPLFERLSVFAWALSVLLTIAAAWLYLSRHSAATHSDGLAAILFTGTDVQDLALSPDGRMFAFTHEKKIWLRRVDSLEAKPIASTEEGSDAFWSPDSKTIGFFRRDEIWRVPVESGSSSLICHIIPNRQFPPATWGADDRILFQDIPDGFYEVSASGGEPKLSIKPDPTKDELVLRDPEFLRDGKTLVLTIRRHGPAVQMDTIAVQTGATRSVVFQLPGALLSAVSASESTGHLLFHEYKPSPGLWAIPFSFSALKTTGKPFLVRADAHEPAVSPSGALFYLAGQLDSPERLAWVDRAGKLVGVFGSPKPDMRDPVVSPNGTLVGVDAEASRWETWVQDSVRNTATNVTGDLYGSAFPAWFPDGATLAFGCGEKANSAPKLCSSPADGSAMPQRLLTLGPDNSINAISLSPDGKSLVFAYRKKQGDSDIWYSSLEKDAQPRPLLSTSFNEAAPRISPDGRYLAYQSDETGRYEVYVRPYPTGDVRWMISNNGGTNPKWGAKDSEIFYLQDDTLMAVPIQSQRKFQASIPHPLFSGKAVNSPMRAFDSPLYDPSPDGKRFVIIREADPGPRSIVVEQKWLNNSSDN